MTVELILFLLLTFLSSALIKGWSGFGTNLIAMPILATMLGYNPAQAVTIVISVNIFMNIAILVENKKFNVKSLENIWVIVVFGVVFTFIGSYFLKNPDNAAIVKIVAGGVITLTGIYKIIVKAKDLGVIFYEDTFKKYFIPAGILSGIFNGIAGLGGLPVLILLSNSDMEKDKFRTTLVSYFLVMNVVAIIGYAVAGNYGLPLVIPSIGWMILPAVGACMFGVYLSRRVSDKIFSNVLIGVLIFMGINLIFSGVFNTNIISYFIDML
jgi:uncharacterized membrane protein YfcA